MGHEFVLRALDLSRKTPVHTAIATKTRLGLHKHLTRRSSAARASGSAFNRRTSSAYSSSLSPITGMTASGSAASCHGNSCSISQRRGASAAFTLRFRQSLENANKVLPSRGYAAFWHDGSSVRIADMPRKKSPRTKCVADQKKSVYSLRDARSSSILTWSRIMIKTPIAIPAAAAVGLSFAQSALGRSH
jgi:hypothetical protein